MHRGLRVCEDISYLCRFARAQSDKPEDRTGGKEEHDRLQCIREGPLRDRGGLHHTGEEHEAEGGRILRPRIVPHLGGRWHRAEHRNSQPDHDGHERIFRNHPGDRAESSKHEADLLDRLPSRGAVAKRKADDEDVPDRHGRDLRIERPRLEHPARDHDIDGGPDNPSCLGGSGFPFQDCDHVRKVGGDYEEARRAIENFVEAEHGDSPFSIAKNLP